MMNNSERKEVADVANVVIFLGGSGCRQMMAALWGCAVGAFGGTSGEILPSLEFLYVDADDARFAEAEATVAAYAMVQKALAPSSWRKKGFVTDVSLQCLKLPTLSEALQHKTLTREEKLVLEQ